MKIDEYNHNNNFNHYHQTLTSLLYYFVLVKKNNSVEFNLDLWEKSCGIFLLIILDGGCI